MNLDKTRYEGCLPSMEGSSSPPSLSPRYSLPPPPPTPPNTSSLPRIPNIFLPIVLPLSPAPCVFSPPPSTRPPHFPLSSPVNVPRPPFDSSEYLTHVPTLSVYPTPQRYPLNFFESARLSLPPFSYLSFFLPCSLRGAPSFFLHQTTAACTFSSARDLS